MASYTLKELREMSTERLIIELVSGANTMGDSVRKKEEKIFRILEERNVIDYKVMEQEYKNKHYW